MKIELIEYHRERIKHFGLMLAIVRPDIISEVTYYTHTMRFHERAVAWLESLDVEEQHESERRGS